MIVKLSELGNRWDAEYHIALHNNQKEVKRLLKKHGVEKIKKICLELPFDSKSASIFRGTSKGKSKLDCATDIEIALYFIFVRVHLQLKIEELQKSEAILKEGLSL